MRVFIWCEGGDLNPSKRTKYKHIFDFADFLQT